MVSRDGGGRGRPARRAHHPGRSVEQTGGGSWSGESETEYIGRCLRTLHAFAHDLNCHVQVLAHPAKMDATRKGRAPELEESPARRIGTTWSTRALLCTGRVLRGGRAPDGGRVLAPQDPVRGTGLRASSRWTSTCDRSLSVGRLRRPGRVESSHLSPPPATQTPIEGQHTMTARKSLKPQAEPEVRCPSRL